MTEIIHTESDAKAALYAAMRRGTDPRWGAEPVEPIKPARPYYGYLIYTALIAGVVGCGVMLLR
jgi:hypothetical protein